MEIDRAELDRRLSDVNALMRAHVGGVVITDINAAGVVTVRFEGKCAGCDLKPLTLAATVRPGLRAAAGVHDVVAEGARISEEAALRIAAAIGADAVRSAWLERVHGKLSGARRD
jgi:Fe-S cluster biogenesis protein NfuA